MATQAQLVMAELGFEPAFVLASFQPHFHSENCSERSSFLLPRRNSSFEGRGD